MILISMTDYVLQQHKESETNGQYIRRTFKYAKFLKQPLSLGMFVPCDLEGNVLEMPHNFCEYVPNMLRLNGYQSDFWYDECRKYQQAKERVLFKGFEITTSQHKGFTITDGWNKLSFYNNYIKTQGNICLNKSITTIEGLSNLKNSKAIILTESAIKQIQ